MALPAYTPFTIVPDLSAGAIESVTYMTNVITAHNDTEQRAALRLVPSVAMTYRFPALDARESALMSAVLYAKQASWFGVPRWMDLRPLTANAAMGAYTVAVDTTDRALFYGNQVLIFQDPFTWFASTMGSSTAGSITLLDPLPRAFPAGKSYAIPLMLGKVADGLPTAWPTNMAQIIALTFDMLVLG